MTHVPDRIQQRAALCALISWRVVPFLAANLTDPEASLGRYVIHREKAAAIAIRRVARPVIQIEPSPLHTTATHKFYRYGVLTA